MRDLSRSDRLKLLEFVCTFAWTDHEIHAEERHVIGQLVQALDMDAEEIVEVQKWLVSPPPIDDVAPLDIPKEHRQLFNDAVTLVVEADGRVEPGERDSLAVFRELLHG